MFHEDSPYRRTNWSPRLAQAAGIPPGPVPVGPQPSPMPVSAPTGTAPLPAPPVTPTPAPATPSQWPTKLLLGGGVALGSGVAWLGLRAGAKEKSTPGKVAAYALAGLGAVKALWDMGTLLGWPADRFPA